MKLTVKFAGIFAVLAFALTAVSADAAFTRDLTLGSTGTDVTELQNVLISAGYSIPAGATGYFGAQTQSALAKWQAAVGIVPAAGYFGPITKAKLAMVVTPDTDEDDDSDSDNGSDLSGGEASLENFDFSSGDDSDVEEGASADIAEIEFDVEDGDVMIDRIDLRLIGSTSTPTNEETDPWETFDSVTLSVDGEEIAEMDLSDEDNYLDEDDGTFRLSGIDYKVAEGETVNIVVSLTAQNSVDGADNNAAEWTINVEDDGIRATDGEGIQQYLPNDLTPETVTFDVEVEGDGEELNVSSSSEDPEATTLKVEDDGKSDMYSFFAFNLESEESDIELDTVEIEVETKTADVQDVVSEFVLEIDGEEFDDWSFVSGATATSSVISFDIDGDYTLDADSEVTVVLMAEFKAAGTNYATTGEEISANIAADGDIQGEGADDVASKGTADSEVHNLEVAGIMIDESGFEDVSSKENNDANTSRNYEFSFDVTAFEEDFYVATSSIAIFVEGAGTSTSSFTVDSTGDEDTTGVFSVNKGDTETFTVVVTLSAVGTAGQYRVGLDSVQYTENSNGLTARSTKDVENADFRTGYETVNK